MRSVYLAVGMVSLKDPLAGIHNWPPAIQQRARELGLIQSEQMAGSKKVYAKKLAAALVIAVFFVAVVYFANGARSFTAGFGHSYLTVAEMGTPGELMKKNEAFARMVRLQTESQNWALESQ